MRFLLFLGFLIYSNIIFAQVDVPIKFTKLYTETKQNTTFYDAETFSDGGYASLGFAVDSANVSRATVARYDCLGKVLWTKSLGPSGSITNTTGGIVEADNGDVVFSWNRGTGIFTGSILAGRISTDGTFKWLRNIGNNKEFGRDIVKTHDGGFIIAGSTGTYGSDRSQDDVYLVKIDSLGNTVWTKTYGNPSSYDEAYGIKRDKDNNYVCTGRFIVNGTFYTFLLKTDGLGNVIFFKGFGKANHRNYGFDILVDKDGNYVFTGMTTLLEQDHSSSEQDVFLIKTDKNGNVIFTNIYDQILGGDGGDIGEGLCETTAGGYAIGVSSLNGFTAHMATGPHAPNKNVLYAINNDGSIHEAWLYNLKGSQYSRVRKSFDSGYLYSGFSTAFAGNIAFQAMFMKLDEAFQTCDINIDVTNELGLFNPPWDVQDITYTSLSGGLNNNYLNIASAYNLREQTICSTPDMDALLDIPSSICQGEEFGIIDNSIADSSLTRILVIDGKDSIPFVNTYKFDTAGKHTINLVIPFKCTVFQYTDSIEVLEGKQIAFEQNICSGDSYSFYGRTLTMPGKYEVKLGNGQACDTIITLDLKITQVEPQFKTLYICSNLPTKYKNREYTKVGKDTIILSGENPLACDTTEYIDIVSILDSCKMILFPNVVTANQDMKNDGFQAFIPKEFTINDWNLEIYNRWGQKVYSTTDYSTAWNGLFNGKACATDTYMYLATYNYTYNGNNITNQKSKGTFSLLH